MSCTKILQCNGILSETSCRSELKQTTEERTKRDQVPHILKSTVNEWDRSLRGLPKDRPPGFATSNQCLEYALGVSPNPLGIHRSHIFLLLSTKRSYNSACELAASTEACSACACVVCKCRAVLLPGEEGWKGTDRKRDHQLPCLQEKPPWIFTSPFLTQKCHHICLENSFTQPR